MEPTLGPSYPAEHARSTVRCAGLPVLAAAVDDETDMTDPDMDPPHAEGEDGQFVEPSAQSVRALKQRLHERTRELRAANERVRELEQLKSAFLSIVSHELRTPMTSIKGYVENMLDGLTGGLTDKQAYYLTRVKYNADRLTGMINDLLDISRIESGRVALSPSRLLVRDLLGDILETFQPMANEKGLMLRVHQADEQVYIKADRCKLFQVLANLTHNALKFTPRNGCISLQTDAAHEATLLFRVTDSGSGIATHELPKVFDRFYRGYSAHVEQRGAGLGLAIAKSFVELHGGRIWVESFEGHGSCFSFTMPLDPL